MKKFDEHALNDAWNEQYAADETSAPKRRRRFSLGQGARTRNVVAATAVAAIGITGVVDAATGGNLREGVRNGTTTQETEIVSNISSSTGLKGGYSTRQSNLSSTGGGAIYGCRSTEGGTSASPPKNPCVRANNLSTGFAFEFNATNGTTAGSINVGSGGDTKKPFVTNATGVATGLNADRLDGANAADIVTAATTAAATDASTKANAAKTRWALINEKGEIEEQSGGFSVIDAYVTNANIYLDAGTSLEGKAVTSTIAIQNKISTDADDAAEPNFQGEISSARCQTVAVECAPAGAKKTSAFVVSPRNSDGTATAGSDANPRKRFYVEIVG